MDIEKTSWRLIEEGREDGKINMVTDHAILHACNEGKAPPTLRLYGWNRPTLSLGYSQNVTRSVDLGRCRLLDIPIIRRPTGGRAVLHNEELTYSVIVPSHHPRFPGGLRQNFQMISTALINGLAQLKILGICVKNGNKRRNAQGEMRSPACFASFNLFEIAAHNRKLIGSAQRRMKNAFLQHGSILIDIDNELLNSLLLFADFEENRSHLEQLSKKTVTLNEASGRTITFEEAKKAFREGFSQVFSEGFSHGELTTFESELRKQLLDKSGLKQFSVIS